MPSSTASRTSTFASNSQSLWEPRTTLNIVSDHRCVGFAVTKGRKCRMPIASHNLAKAATLLDELSTQQPDSEALRTSLHRLGGYLLCKQFHQYQSSDVIEDWSRRMDAVNFVEDGDTETTRDGSSDAQGPRSPTRTVSRSSSRSVSRSSTPSRHTASSSSHVSLPAHSSREALQETITALQDTLRVAERRLAQLDYPSPPTTRHSSPTISRVSTSDISSLTLSRSSTIQPPSPNTQPQASPSTPSQDSRNAVPSTSRTCTRTHIRRRAIDDECPICKEDFLLRDRLVWCKNSCGRTVHRSCFDAWRESCESAERGTTCTLCRAVWDQECDCGDED